MNIKELSDRVLFALSVPKCVCCRERLDYGQIAFCPKCYSEFEEIKTRNCSRCAKKLSLCDCSNAYLEAHFVRRVVKSFRYLISAEANPANALVFSLKTDNRSDVLELCKREMSAAIMHSVDSPQDCIITNVPRRRSAIIQHGIDHSGHLAKAVAAELGAEYIPLLKSLSKKPQKSLERTERIKNAEFKLINDIDLSGRRVIIVDDIITTGASMGNAAALIRSLGAKKIVAASLGIAYKDKFETAYFDLK